MINTSGPCASPSAHITCNFLSLVCKSFLKESDYVLPFKMEPNAKYIVKYRILNYFRTIPSFYFSYYEIKYLKSPCLDDLIANK